MKGIYQNLVPELCELAFTYDLKHLRAFMEAKKEETGIAQLMCRYCCFYNEEEDGSDFYNGIDASLHWLWRDEVIWTLTNVVFKRRKLINRWNWDSFGEYSNVDIYVTFVAIITWWIDRYVEDATIQNYLEVFGDAIVAYKNRVDELNYSIEKRNPFI